MKFVLLLVSLFFAACTSMNLVPEKPQVALKNVELGKVGLTDVELIAVLDVTNPNDYDLNLAAIDYQVDALGMTLGKGSSLEAIRLQPHMKQTVKLPLTLTTASAVKFGQAYYSPGQKQLPVSLQATVKVNSPVGPISLNFEDVKDLKEKKR
ncbi:MAG TPA: LEA type 2 family protein [Oligoflexus sp.]|uniref:LEA type 2 family protein n=1 Tax=Oligoflexus sp. TaxID=1971216 RepID=UPI002D7EAACD|nr:LEA type 2 family protein [Oligoflexus sp.]HET9237146.1 LEA type 2 family protein [Oligoflexus sp.]